MPNNKYSIPCFYLPYFYNARNTNILAGFEVTIRLSKESLEEEYLEIAIDEAALPADSKLDLIKKALAELQKEYIANSDSSTVCPDNKQSNLAKALNEYCYGEEKRKSLLKDAVVKLIVISVGGVLVCGLVAGMLTFFALAIPPLILPIIVLAAVFSAMMAVAYTQKVLGFLYFRKDATLLQRNREAKLETLVNPKPAPEYKSQKTVSFEIDIKPSHQANSPRLKRSSCPGFFGAMPQENADGSLPKSRDPSPTFSQNNFPA